MYNSVILLSYSIHIEFMLKRVKHHVSVSRGSAKRRGGRDVRAKKEKTANPNRLFKAESLNNILKKNEYEKIPIPDTTENRRALNLSKSNRKHRTDRRIRILTFSYEIQTN